MEYLIVLCIGVAAASAFWIAVIRRADKKPTGNTAKLVQILKSGGGGGPDPGGP
jgi:hypothetical protein